METKSLEPANGVTRDLRISMSTFLILDCVRIYLHIGAIVAPLVTKSDLGSTLNHNITGIKRLFCIATSNFKVLVLNKG